MEPVECSNAAFFAVFVHRRGDWGQNRSHSAKNPVFQAFHKGRPIWFLAVIGRCDRMTESQEVPAKLFIGQTAGPVFF
jgi:hypothetical protein